MIEPQTEVVEQAPEPVVVEPIPDYYLLVLTKLLESVSEDSSIGISFNVSGGLVYGNLITRGVWQKLWVSQVSEANDFVGEVLTQITQSPEDDADEDDGDGLVRFVHLKNATYVSGDTRYRMGLWRAPLAHIAGWSNSTPNE
jgi:hypothetical protein